MKFEELKPGTTVGGQKISSYRSHTKADQYIYLMAGVHGDEVEGVYVVDKLFKWLETEKLDIPLIVIPILNVDGYRDGTRTNAHGVDLNRNLPSSNWSKESRGPKYHPGQAPMSENENVYLCKLFEKFPPSFILTVHSWKPMINYNDDCLKLANFMATFNDYEVAGDIGYPTPGSLGHYAPEKYKSPVITYELPTFSDELSLEQIWLENEEAFKQTFTSDILNPYL